MNSSSLAPWQAFKDLFAIDHLEVEKKVEDLPGHYKGLNPLALYTPYEDLYSLILNPLVEGTWVDLGAGVGESAVMYASLFPERRAIGIEFEGARVQEGKALVERLRLLNVELFHGDLLTCEIPDAETYFLYFPTGPVLDRLLDEIRKKPRFKQLIAIESHGDLLARLGKENWLKVNSAVELSAQRHHQEALFMSRIAARDENGPHQQSYKNNYLLIEEADGSQWIGDSFGLEWLKDGQYQLLHPPRTIEWTQVKEILTVEQLAPEVVRLVGKRKECPHGIRKIYVKPTLKVEMADGQIQNCPLTF